MLKRWLWYLAALSGSIGLYLTVPCWWTWAVLLTVAGLPLCSVVVGLTAVFSGKAVANCGWVYDSLGLFRLPAGKPKWAESCRRELRRYQPGDRLSRVHWKLTAKTGKLTVWEEVWEQNPKSRLSPWWGIAPVVLCCCGLLLLFPPWKYDQQMDRLQRYFLRSYPPVAQMDLTAGPPSAQPQAVMDVVASQSQVLYLRGQAFDAYDGRSWTATDTALDIYWPEGEQAAVGLVRIATRGVLPQMYTPYYIVGDAYQMMGGGMKNTAQLREYTFYQQRQVGSIAIGQKPTRYLQLPESTGRWAEGVLAQLWQEELTDREKVEKIQDFVRSCAQYDKNTPKMPAQSLDFTRWFVEESGSGYCVHFATAAAVLLRSAGIPARLVSGYMVTVQAGVRKTVIGDDAHAWVEYLDGGVWRILEATPTEEVVAPPAQLPEEEESAEGREREYDFRWVWPAVVVILLISCLHVRWRKEETSDLVRLAQKAAYSRYGLTPNEMQQFEDLVKQSWRLRKTYSKLLR